MSIKGQELRRLRRKRGLSMRDLSRLSGVSIAHISDMENGQKTNITTDTICKLAKALEVDPGDLFNCSN